MGYLGPKPTDMEEVLVNDIYTLFKCNKNQDVLADNLQNVLLAVSGLKDETA